MQELTTMGTRREMLARVHDLKFRVLEDRITFDFKLNRGNYATSFLREYIKSDSVLDY
jgi:tRNA(Glu) U13 pseudouridine synthase TruD